MNDKYWLDNITKEQFLKTLCSDSLALLYPKKAEGLITTDQYWNYYYDLVSKAEDLFDVKITR